MWWFSVEETFAPFPGIISNLPNRLSFKMHATEAIKSRAKVELFQGSLTKCPWQVSQIMIGNGVSRRSWTF
jgi:hypothetical protein